MNRDIQNENCLFIGSFANGLPARDGQTIKTKILYSEIKSKGIFKKSLITDTYNWKNKPFKLILQSLAGILKSEYIIISFSKNGMKLYFPFLYYINKILNRKIYHFVIGGDLPQKVSCNKSWPKYLKSFNCNYVEIDDIKKGLEVYDIRNCKVIPNFKRLNIVKRDEVMIDFSIPFKVCTFSRICKEKGIEDAIKAVSETNKTLGKVCYELTIFGLPDTVYKEEFEKLKDSFPSYIRYGGLVDFHKSTDILKDYFLLLFPTYHKEEGFPGTLIDAFAAGLPVIAADWNYNSKIVKDKITGRIFKVHDVRNLVDILLHYNQYPKEVIQMKYNCIETAENYLPDIALRTFYDDLGITAP